MATLSSYLQRRRTGELNEEEPPMYLLSCLFGVSLLNLLPS